MSFLNKEDNIIFEIIYKPNINKEDKTRLFGENFVNNNKDKFKIIYMEKELEITDFFEDIENNCEHLELITIKLKIIKQITNLSYMFSECNKLYSVSNVSYFNNSNITDSHKILCDKNIVLNDALKNDTIYENEKKDNLQELFYIYTNAFLNKNISNPNRLFDEFYGGNQLSSLSISNIINMNDNSKSIGNTILNDLQDLSNIDTSQVIDMSWMFYGCNSLISLPNISKWNTSNVTKMDNMFRGCKSLISLPDISKWNTSSVIDMRWMFYECCSLKSLPDLSRWETTNVISMVNFFCKCNSLISLPNISNWNTSNVTIMIDMFSECGSLKTLPDISNWNTSKVTDMNRMFKGCSSLISLPDISNWDISKVYGVNSIFAGCCSLLSLPDISKWNTSNITDMRWMFCDCHSLVSGIHLMLHIW